MTSPRPSTTDRRTVLTGLAATLGSIGLAGCTDDTDTDGDDELTNGSDSSDNSDSNDDGLSGEVHEEYESTDVSVMTPDGEELGNVTAAIVDTPERRRVGLSETDELPEDRGMLFVYDEVDDRTFGMPNMSFGIDIVYADDEGVITEIHHAPQPDPDEDGTEPEHVYPGRGQYVLEVVYEWTDEHDVEEGDVLEFDLDG
ncbi:DUF192 domain-containing protein [Natrialbaceae archaeon A-arb3/5]